MRLCPRSGAVDAPNAMHALLLCAEGREAETRTFATLQQDGLRPARSEPERALDLHLLGVSVLRLDLNGAVTLFGLAGEPGTPISAPNSWIVQLQPVVWPLSEHLCHRFNVMPCAPESWRPREEQLLPFAAQEASLAAELYWQQFSAEGHRACDVRHEALADALSTLASPASSDDPAERVLLAALEMPLLGGRASVGSAYARLAAQDDEHPLARLLLEVSCQLGSDAGLR